MLNIPHEGMGTQLETKVQESKPYKLTAERSKPSTWIQTSKVDSLAKKKKMAHIIFKNGRPKSLMQITQNSQETGVESLSPRARFFLLQFLEIIQHPSDGEYY